MAKQRVREGTSATTSLARITVKNRVRQWDDAICGDVAIRPGDDLLLPFLIVFQAVLQRCDHFLERRDDVIERAAPRLAERRQVEDLATKQICSAKTVENVERRANVYVCTLAKAAKGLGVEFMTLVQGDKPPQEPPKPQPRVQMQFGLSIPFVQFDESEQWGGLAAKWLLPEPGSQEAVTLQDRVSFSAPI